MGLPHGWPGAYEVRVGLPRGWPGTYEVHVGLPRGWPGAYEVRVGLPFGWPGSGACHLPLPFKYLITELSEVKQLRLRPTFVYSLHVAGDSLTAMLQCSHLAFLS